MYKLKKRLKNEKGQGMVEYGLILALVSIVAILGLSTLGGNIKGQLEGIADSMESFESFEPGQGPWYSDEEIDDLIKNHHFIPVATADELNNVRSATSETYGTGTKWEGPYTGGLDKKYIQVAYIDLRGIETFEPIGKLRSEFTGTFDGGGYIISNLTIDKGSESYVGLFGRDTGATFKNVGLEDVNVTGGSHTGGLVGYQYESSTVSNSYATGSVTGTGTGAGGLVGSQDGASVSNSYWDKDTTGQEASEGGTGKSTAEMKNKDTYTDWDNTIWEFKDGQYPTLR